MQAEIRNARCRRAGAGQEKRAYYEAHLGQVKEILADGERRARARPGTMRDVHRAMTW